MANYSIADSRLLLFYCLRWMKCVDLANPKTNSRTAGFTKEEREEFTNLLNEGFIDAFRQLYPDKTGAYSYWSYMGNARARNVGW